MKRKLALCVAAVLITLPLLQLPAMAATIDKAAPYQGQYLLGCVPTKAGASAYTGALSATNSQEPVADLSGFDGAVMGTDTVDGQTRYQIEPEVKQVDPALLMQKEESVQAFSMESVEALALGDIKQFSAFTELDYPTQSYTVTAQVMALGEYCTVYVETAYVGDNDSSKISSAQAAVLAAEFDRIQAIMQEDFGPYLSNSDGKIVILLHDIKEYLAGNSGNTYVAGFFSSADYLGPQSGGNSTLMVHLDIPQLMWSWNGWDITKGYSTLAHEFQHLINFSDSYFTWLRTRIWTWNDLWLNEMLSMAAQHMLYGTLTGRIYSYNYSAKVRSGAVLTYKLYSTNGVDELGGNYGLPYLFGQYLRVQTEGLAGSDGAVGGNGIFKQLLNSDYTDYRAVTEALSNLGYPVTDFTSLENNFRIATFLNEKAGYYGFCGDMAFAGVRAPVYAGSGVILNPGAAVIMALPSGTFTPAPGAGTSFLAFSQDIEGIHVTDGNGDDVSALTDNQRLDLTAYSDHISDGQVPVMVAGLYTKEGKMLKLWGFSGKSGYGKTTGELTLPAGVQGCYLKVFYMNGSVGCTPLCQVMAIG